MTRRRDGEGSKSDSGQESRWWKILAAVATLAILGIGWYLDLCLREQKETVRGMKDTWASVRKTSQKYIDDRIALYEEMGLFYRRLIEDNPSAEWIAGRQQELINGLEKTENSCNAAKSTRYDFDRKLGPVCEAFSIQRPDLLNTAFVEQMCGIWSQAAARLRAVNVASLAKTPPEIKAPLYRKALATLEEDRRVVDATREAERNHNRRVEEFFGQIERRSIFTNLWSCAKATGGSRGIGTIRLQHNL